MSQVAAQEESAEDGRRRLSRVMAVRLAVALGVLGLALVFVGGGDGAEAAADGLYGTLGVAFLATVMFAGALRWVQNVPRYAALQLLVDASLVSSVVLFSGGCRSIFSFLYLPIVVLGAIQFGRRGGYGAAVLASAGFAAVVAYAPPSPFDTRLPDAPEVKLAIWGVHTAALLLVSLLSSTLAQELRRAGEDLHASRKQFERLELLHQRTVDSLTSGLLTTDAHGLVRSCNPEGARILGVAAESVLGKPLSGVIPGVELLAQPGAEAGGRARSRLEREVPGGATQYLGIAVSVLRATDGRHDGHVVIFQDVSTVVALEAELQRSARLAGIGELSASIAHEIRNPLAAISGSVEMLEREPLATDRERLMTIVLREIERLDRLIADFLRYARPAPPACAWFDLGPLLEEIAALSASESWSLAIDVPEGLRLWADADQLRQVFWNLIRNAGQASEGGATVAVSARCIDGAAQDDSAADRNAAMEGCGLVEIEIRDQGEGIGPERLERIFDPFYTTKVAGSGLGLPIVHRILEAHGATLQVDSQPSVGTTFRVRLPLPAAEED